jgi:hypothetical protein
MKADDKASFEKRWQAAIRTPEVVVAKVQKRSVDLSIETIIDRYAMMLDAAVAEHSLEKPLRDEVVASLSAVKQRVKLLDPQKLNLMKFRLPTP